MFIRGLLFLSEDDNVYSIRDRNRKLGSVIRIYVPSDPPSLSVKKAFRCFGENFDSLFDVAFEFLKIKGCRPYNE